METTLLVNIVIIEVDKTSGEHIYCDYVNCKLDFLL